MSPDRSTVAAATHRKDTLFCEQSSRGRITSSAWVRSALGTWPVQRPVLRPDGPLSELDSARPQTTRVRPSTSRVVEIGSGVGANLRYLPAEATLVAIEPNPHMHGRLRTAARRKGVRLELHDHVGERIDLPDQSVDVVISSLVLCSVTDPAHVLAEIIRILRPGGRYSFVEHVAAPADTLTRALQRMFRRPWGWAFEGCSCERDLESTIRAAGFTDRRRHAISSSHAVDPFQHAHRRHRPHLTAAAQNRQRIEPGVSSAVPTAVAVRGLTS